MVENSKKRKADELSNPSASSSPPSYLSPASRPSSPRNWLYDVFPSFRGEDVRIDFLSHIQKEFKIKGIRSFDDNGIERGESISPELIRAIRGSKIAIVLLSTNYASSTWCLEELVEIMNCRKLDQTVMTIFYKVDASEVKKLTGDFGTVFRKTCEGKTEDDIERWKQALEKVATIAGYPSRDWDSEAAMIEAIAADVLKKLFSYAPSSDFDDLVGMKAHMQKMEPFLLLGSGEVKMIGIWGPSGIGKSTIARFLFSQHSDKFQHSLFMDDIKINNPRFGMDQHGTKLKLQGDFISRIFDQTDIKIQHLGVAPDRLKGKRILVVLDDVDHSSQLEALAKKASWFGPGSIIIVTTQDKNVFKEDKTTHIYEVKCPPDNEALKILCINAFGQKSPDDGFEKLAWEVTKLVGNLPLGLKVMGSYFKGRSKLQWEQKLPSLRSSLDGEIEKILKLSYKALNSKDQKALFLHIACFFNGERIERVIEYLSDKFPGVEPDICVLTEKSLIYVDWGCIKMHDLLARLGREIVRKQSIDEPGERQFLVDAGDICQVLSNDTLGSRKVIGIDFKYIKLGKELKISDRAFEKMSNVRFLRLRTDEPFQPIPYVIESVNYLPDNLRLLSWDFCPLTCLPSNFNPEFLVEISMFHSKLHKLWEGNQMIRNLKRMILRFCENLKELPDLSTATNLEILNLYRCSSLTELPSSIWNLNLSELDLGDCSSLKELPSSIENAINLKKLDLSGCSSLTELPSSIGNAVNLEKLDLSGCSSLTELPSSIGNVIYLEKLDLSDCSNLVGIPSSIWNLVNLRSLNLFRCSSLVKIPSSSGNSIIKLKELHLFGCTSLRELPSSMENATNLEVLDLSACSSLTELPSFIGNATNLEVLDLFGCSSLTELPSSIGNAINLEVLDLTGCSNLVGIPSSIWNLVNLRSLYLTDCSSLVKIPSSSGNSFIKLKELRLGGCTSLRELPSFIENATNLEILNLYGWSSLTELPSYIGNAIKLKELCLGGCTSLRELPSFIENATNLKRLNLSDWSSLTELPSYIGNAIKLKELCLIGCTNLRELPSSMENATNLKRLYLDDCSSLVELPSSVINSVNLKHVTFSGCSSLVELPSYLGNATYPDKLDLRGYSSLRKLPSSIGNLINLKILNLNGCSSLVEVPSSIGNLINLKKLLLGCSSLVEVPSSIGNLINLKKLLLGCSSLVEVPSFIGNLINLEKLYLNGCSSLVELPSSIGNLHNLQRLCLKGCSKLKSLPININIKSLDFIDLTDCSSLKSFPEISTNISVLVLIGTAIEVPPSIRSWPRLVSLHMSYSENLKKSQHAFDRITELHVSDPRIQEIAPWIKEMSRLDTLVIKRGTKLVSLPQLPGSLRSLIDENLESLEGLDCSLFFRRNKCGFGRISF